MWAQQIAGIREQVRQLEQLNDELIGQNRDVSAFVRNQHGYKRGSVVSTHSVPGSPAPSKTAEQVKHDSFTGALLRE